MLILYKKEHIKIIGVIDREIKEDGTLRGGCNRFKKI